MTNITALIATKKNLLAFSGGVDSTALFFILLSLDIPFDIAIVDYNQRESSKDEVKYAQELALKYNKKCFIKIYENEKFSEKSARDFRYVFFTQIIKENGYKSLITAHQLNDKLEWFLMQLSKGAGLPELIGLQELEIREDFTLYRPLLEISKNELLEYLDKNNIKYFTDETNFDPKYKRNFFRQKFSDDFVKLYKDGLKKSFSYLQKILWIKSLKKNVEFAKSRKMYEVICQHSKPKTLKIYSIKFNSCKHH
ncbi:MAG: tRNA lysidine(34) synthetase TilS [Arcobacter sp.]|nr:tRNA lysidine(34) synthetase TilS [Arcobacter sp.]